MKQLFTYLFLAVSITLFSQKDFHGKATYKTHRKTDIKIEGEESHITSEIQKQLEDQMKKMFQKTFILNFNASESTYKEDANLASPKSEMGGVMIKVIGNSGGSNVLYKNIKEKRFSNKTDIMGKVFLVKDSLQNYQWNLSGETKNIGNYTCYKATFSREVERKSHTIEDGKEKEEKKMETIVTNAWYTPQIPISNGPKNFGGLPGLILEINDGRLTIVCTEIVLNPSKKIKIEEPTKGKIVSQEKFNKIREEKTKEMMERFRSRKGDKNALEINIGG